MKKYEEVKTSDYEIGITKITDKKVKEIHGYLSTEFGEPVFKITKVEFEDGKFLGAEGKHDFPYLTGFGDETVDGYDDDNLENIYKTDPDNEDEEE